MKNNQEITYDHMQWMCRRGMLELDLLLSEMIKRDYTSLSDQQKKELAAFVQQDDPVLYYF